MAQLRKGRRTSPKPTTPSSRGRKKTATLRPAASDVDFFEADDPPKTPVKKTDAKPKGGAASLPRVKLRLPRFDAETERGSDSGDADDSAGSPTISDAKDSDDTGERQQSGSAKVSPAKRSGSPSLVDGVKRFKLDSAVKPSSTSKVASRRMAQAQESPTQSVKATKKKIGRTIAVADASDVIDMSESVERELGPNENPRKRNKFVDDEAIEDNDDHELDGPQDVEMTQDEWDAMSNDSAREVDNESDGQDLDVQEIVGQNPAIRKEVFKLLKELKSGRVSSNAKTVQSKSPAHTRGAVQPVSVGQEVLVVDDDDDEDLPSLTPKKNPPTFVPGTNQTELGSPFKKDDIKRGPMDSNLWDSALWDMYTKYNNPDRIVAHRAPGQVIRLKGPDFDDWVGVKRIKAFLFKLLEFTHNGHFVNPSRVDPSELIVHNTRAEYPKPSLRYIAWKDTTNPVLCVSLVQVRKSTLINADQVKSNKGGETRFFEKKSIIANLFAQEQELFNSVVGTVFDANTIILPIWDVDRRGLTFQTKLSRKNDVPVRHGGKGDKSGNYQEDIIAVPSNRIQPAIWANGTMPVFDARKEGFSLTQSLGSTRLTALKSEIPEESLGALFYTVCDDDSNTPNLALNFQAFMLLATQEDRRKGTVEE